MTANQKSDNEKKDAKKSTLSLSGTLSLGGGNNATNAAPRPRAGGGPRGVQVVKRRHVTKPGAGERKALSGDERSARLEALKAAQDGAGTGLNRKLPPRPVQKRPEPKRENPKATDKRAGKEDARAKELEELKRVEAEANKAQAAKDNARKIAQQRFQQTQPAAKKSLEQQRQERMKKRKSRMGEQSDRRGKLTVSQVLSGDHNRDRQKSLSAVKRQRRRAREDGPEEPREKISREVTIPDYITVQELSNRMSERSGDVIKTLMGMGMMVTVTQTLDADTAQLITEEMGHTVKRVSESDIEDSLGGEPDAEADLAPRAPVVTIMGHVDHGKTSLLDAIRGADVAGGESGGITQHIGAYQVKAPSGEPVTFIDTPGHAAFTEMRARGANTTDIVVLVVAADDGVKPQTIEAISHAKAAGVPIIVAVNKIDLPDVNPRKVREELLQHEIVVEDMGGDVMAVDVSAKAQTNLDKLLEAIMLQAEVLELKANADRAGSGAIVEAKMEQGRGSVATVLVQRGTVRVGDIFVAGAEWGKVRALVNHHGKRIKEAGPSVPVEVLGLNGTPDAGDDFVVVDSEAKARQVTSFRSRKKQDKLQAMMLRGSSAAEQLFSKMSAEGSVKELNVVIKGDVHGSIEAIVGALNKLTEDNEEVAVKVLHTGVGAVNESDITLAASTNAMIVAFNVRANAQAREAARRDNIEIRYYSIIYNVLDDAKALLSGMLDPTVKETFIGYAEVRAVFNITKVGKIAGCIVTEGLVRRGAKIRLLRDNVVLHEGEIKSLRREKDDVKEVRQGTECGIAFENYDDLKEGDVIEAFETEEIQREI